MCFWQTSSCWFLCSYLNIIVFMDVIVNEWLSTSSCSITGRASSVLIWLKSRVKRCVTAEFHINYISIKIIYCHTEGMVVVVKYAVICYKSVINHSHLQFRHVGGLIQKNISSELLLAPADVGEQNCFANLKRTVASQELKWRRIWLVKATFLENTPQNQNDRKIHFLCILYKS